MSLHAAGLIAQLARTARADQVWRLEEVTATPGTSIEGLGLGGVLRLTWGSDQLAHVLEHSQADEPAGAWTGLACFDHDLGLGADVDDAELRRLSAHSDIADLVSGTTRGPRRRTQSAMPCCDPCSSGRRAGGGRAALAAGPGPVVPGMVSELPGARALAGHRPEPLRPGQAAALGGRLLRAPLRPARPPAPPYPQHRHHRPHHRRALTVRWCLPGQDGAQGASSRTGVPCCPRSATGRQRGR